MNEAGSYGYMADIFTDDWYQHHPGGESSREFAWSLGDIDGPVRISPTQNMPVDDAFRIMAENLRNALNEAKARGITVTIEKDYYRVYQYGKVLESFYKSTYGKWSHGYKIQFWNTVGL